MIFYDLVFERLFSISGPLRKERGHNELYFLSTDSDGPSLAVGTT